MKKIKEIITDVVREMSATGTGAGMTSGENPPIATSKAFKKPTEEIKDVEPKLAAGKVKDNYAVSHFGYTLAPSTPDRKSKAIDYKQLFQEELSEVDTQNTNTDEILTYLQAAKEQGSLSPDAQQVLLQWMNSPGASREEIIRVLKQLTGVYLRENYAHFRNETSKRNPSEQLHKAVKEIKRKLQEVDKLVEYTNRLRTEISEGDGDIKYNTHTERALESITEMIKQTYIKTKKLK